jgi:hypothetical protein
MTERVVIRLSGKRLAVGLAFASVWLGILLPITAVTLVYAPSPRLIPLVLLTVAGFLMGARTLGMSVIADGNGLRVRNAWRQKRFASSDIDSFFEYSPVGKPIEQGGVVAVKLRSGRIVNLLVTATGASGREARTVNAARLQDWLKSSSPGSAVAHTQRRVPRHVKHPRPSHPARPRPHSPHSGQSDR